MTGQRTLPRQRLSGDQRRERFLDAATEIILDAGVDGLTMEGLASRTGVSKALGYRYFDNRDDVLVALLDRENTRYDAQISAALAHAHTFEQRVRAMYTVFLDVVAQRGALFGTLMQARLGRSSAFESRRRRRDREVESFVAALIVDETGAGRTDARIAARVLLAGAIGTVLGGPDRSIPRALLIDAYVRLAVGAVNELRSR